MKTKPRLLRVWLSILFCGLSFVFSKFKYCIDFTFNNADGISVADKGFNKCSALSRAVIIIPYLLIFCLFIFGNEKAVGFDGFSLKGQCGDKLSVNVGGFMSAFVFPCEIKLCECGIKCPTESILCRIKSFLCLMSSGDNTGQETRKQNGEEPNEQFFNQVMALTVLLCVLWLGFILPLYLLIIHRTTSS